MKNEYDDEWMLYEVAKATRIMLNQDERLYSKFKALYRAMCSGREKDFLETKDAFVRLSSGYPITPLNLLASREWDTDTVTKVVGDKEQRVKIFHSRRYDPLYVEITEIGDGKNRVEIFDYNYAKGYNFESPKDSKTFPWMQGLCNTLFPISFPYTPRDEKFTVRYVEIEDMICVLDIITPDGERSMIPEGVSKIYEGDGTWSDSTTTRKTQ